MRIVSSLLTGVGAVAAVLLPGLGSVVFALGSVL